MSGAGLSESGIAIDPAATPASPAVSRAFKPARPRSLLCPNCGAAVTVRASGSSVTAACGSCGSVLDVANEDVKLIAAAQARVRTPLIPIGTRGVLEGTEWEVVGWQERSSEAGSWRWEEFLLWNPYQGFRFLGQDHGNWTFYTMLRKAVSDDGRIAGDPTDYKPTETVTARTDYVLGEFYWRVKVGDQVQVREFIAPPASLSQERDGSEVTWSYGTYVAPETVQAAFKLASVPGRTEPADNEPEAPSRRLSRLWTVASAAVLLLIALQAVPFGVARNQVLLRQSFTAVLADKGRPTASDLFDVPGAEGNLALEATMARNNDPLTLELAIVSEDGQRRFDGTVELSDSFDQRMPLASLRFASVPAGRYKLLATPSSIAFAPVPSGPPGTPGSTNDYLNAFLRGANPKPPDQVKFDYTVTVRRHTPVMDYFWIALLGLVGWPVVVSVWRYWRNQEASGDSSTSTGSGSAFAWSSSGSDGDTSVFDSSSSDSSSVDTSSSSSFSWSDTSSSDSSSSDSSSSDSSSSDSSSSDC